MLYYTPERLRIEIRASAGEEDKTEELVLTQDNADTVFYRYDAFNRLVSVEDGENTAGYTYDGNNLRQSKTVNGVTTTHIYDGAEVTADITGDRQSVYVRDLNGILFREENGEKMHYISNPRGDVSAYYYSRTRLLPTYTYDAFGNQTEASGTDPFRYSGEYYDAESGFIYLRNRYYDPGIGRFITEDPAQSGTNWYVYANNNPLTYIDPWGLKSYIFYNPDDFATQVESEAMRMRENFGTEVQAIRIRTEQEFIKAWNSMGMKGESIDGVALIFHGRPDAIMIDYHNDEYLTVYDSGITAGGASATYIGDKSKFQDKSIKKLYIQSCNTGLIDYENNVARVFVNNYSVNSVIAWDGGTGYTNYFYFDNQGKPRNYAHIRLSYDQSAFNSWRQSKRKAEGRIQYTKNGYVILGNPRLEPNAIIDSRRIYMGMY